MEHPLDRPVWSALTTRLAAHAQGEALAKRIDPAIGLFVAAADRTDDGLAAFAALLPDHGDAGTMERLSWPIPAGHTAIVTPCSQMVATAPRTDEPGFAYRLLTEADAPAMLALATLTQPGPFRAGTPRIGRFYGVECDGAIVAMAGTRLAIPGFTEISGVCTHPDHRGRGYAGGLMMRVARDIAAAGDACFLHVRSANSGAIGLYGTLGFAVRTTIHYSLFTRIRPI